MSKDKGEARNVMAGIRFVDGVAGGISVGNRRRTGEAPRGETVEGGDGASACGMKDMGPHSGIHPDQILD